MLPSLTFYMGSGAQTYVTRPAQQALCQLLSHLTGPRRIILLVSKRKEDPGSVPREGLAPWGIWILVQDKFYMNKHGWDAVHPLTHTPSTHDQTPRLRSEPWL